MRRHFRWDKKYLYWGVTAFCVIACAILFYMALNYIGLVGKALRSLVTILSPFIWGLVISYLLNPLVRTLEKKLFGPLCRRIYAKSKRSNGEGLARGLSVLFSEIFMLAIVTGLFFLIIPQLYSSIETIIVNSPVYIDKLTTWATKMLTDFPELRSYVTQMLGDINQDLMSWLQTSVLPGLGSLLSNVGTGVKYVVTGVYNLVIGIIVSVYILSDSETFTANAKRILYSLLTPEMAKKLLEGLDFTDRTFVGFLNGKLLDSAIIGLICYIVCAILDMPYALLVSVLVGVTNIIPFFGPFIGAVPSALVILMVSPLKCLIFVIFVIILQQVDGNIIGPKILGDRLGISDFWILVSITVFGSLFGFGGMLLGVPVFTVIYALIAQAVNNALSKKKLPQNSEHYYSILTVEDLKEYDKEFGEPTVFYSGDTFETEYDPDDDFEFDDSDA